MDKNLKDNWLTRLNSLESLRPISICEGHSDQKAGSSRTLPHVKLRLQDRFLPGMAHRWDQFRPILAHELHRLFNGVDTFLELELRFKFRWGKGRFPYRENLTVRIHSRQARASKEMDARTYEWFEQTLKRIEELDGVIEAHIHPSD